MKVVSVIIGLLLGFAIGNAESRYYDYLTGFDSISANTVDGYLQLKSSRKAPIFDATNRKAAVGRKVAEALLEKEADGFDKMLNLIRAISK